MPAQAVPMKIILGEFTTRSHRLFYKENNCIDCSYID